MVKGGWKLSLKDLFFGLGEVVASAKRNAQAQILDMLRPAGQTW